MRILTMLLVVGIFFEVSGCASQSRYYSSAVDYLYPGESAPVKKPSIPVMSLPMKVGLAFVPDGENKRDQSFWQKLAPGLSRKPSGFVLPEKHKIELMKTVRGHFKKYPYIKSIEIIPSLYLKERGSFANLDQIRTMYGVDAIALLSYDQVQFTDEGAVAFLYWTIVGAYVIPGEKNTTQTMMDAIVIDIKSRKMLFRAPGVSQVKGSATPVNLTEELRVDSEKGFNDAAKDMIGNLDMQLALFKEKIKEEPEEYKVTHKQGYKGGSGSIDGVFLLLLLSCVGVIRWQQSKYPSA